MIKDWKEGEFENRVKDVLTEELKVEEHWMYLSFADKVFKGGVIIKAHGVTDALMKCNLLKINPGGEVLPFDLVGKLESYIPEESYRNRLLTKEEVQKIWPDAKSIKELEKEECI